MVLAVGPIGNRASPGLREVFPSATEIWGFLVNIYGFNVSAFFPDDQASAIMERARLVEAMNKIKMMNDATNAADIIKAEIEANKQS